MELRRISVERYKGYNELVHVDVAPLTILVGPNNAGKTALARAIQLWAGNLTTFTSDVKEPLHLEFDGVRHGSEFIDLVTGRSVHGWVGLSVVLASDSNDVSLSVRVQNVEASDRPTERQVTRWILSSGDEKVELTRKDFGVRASYAVSVSGIDRDPQQISWRGLVPQDLEALPDWVTPKMKAIRSWAEGVRYLQCPRCIPVSPFSPVDHQSMHLGPRGKDTPFALAANDELRKLVRNWYRSTFGVSLNVGTQGRFSELEVRAPTHDSYVSLGQSGRGLSQVLPIVVMAMTARTAGAGVDIIEHPEAELHPAAHADIAELLLENLAGSVRPLILETHSEMVLLRARRWIAEGKLQPENVLVYWVSSEPDRGSVLQKIRVTERGEVSGWPSGVFIEDYEEILAIRRAARKGA